MSTKIINIQKDDSNEDILDILKKSPAQEVILILPARHEALSTPEHFAELAVVANEYDKNPLVLSSNPDINDLAAQHDIGILTVAKVGTRGAAKKKKPAVKIKPEVESGPDLRIEPQPKAEPAPVVLEPEKPVVEERVVLEPTEPERSMVDIIEPPFGKVEPYSIKIDEHDDVPEEVQINKEPVKERNIMDELQSVWQRPRNEKSAVKPPVDDDRPPFAMSGVRVDAPYLRIFRKPLFLMGLLAVIAFGAVLYMTTGSASIIVKPRPKAIENLNLKILASDKFSSVDSTKMEIPGQLFSVEKKIEETFPATGEKDVVQKAKGKLVVTNEYGTTPQVLIATTRFESSGGLVFRTLKTVTVPGTTVKNGKITPGTVEVEVIADKAGNEYNIGAGKFTIPAFKEKNDMDRYSKFYGVSSEPMKGGIIGKAKVVTEQDYLNANNKVKERMLTEVQNDLKNQAAGLVILKLSDPAIKDLTSSAQVDEAVDEFTISGISTLKTVGFMDKDLDELIIQHIVGINDLVVIPDKLTMDYSGIEFIDADNTLKFNVAVKGPAYTKINQDKLVSDLIGKNEEGIKEYVKKMEGTVTSVRVFLKPFWVRRVPENREKIIFEFQYE